MFDSLQVISHVTVYTVLYQGEPVGAPGEFRTDQEHDGPMGDSNAFYAAADYIARGVRAGNARTDYRVITREEVKLGGNLGFVDHAKEDKAVDEILTYLGDEDDANA